MKKYTKNRKGEKGKKTSFSDIKDMLDTLSIASPKVEKHQNEVWKIVSSIYEDLAIYGDLPDNISLKFFIKKVELQSSIVMFFSNISKFKNPFKFRHMSTKKYFIHSKYTVEFCICNYGKLTEGFCDMEKSAQEFIDNCDKESHVIKAQKLRDETGDILRRCDDILTRLNKVHAEMILIMDRI